MFFQLRDELVGHIAQEKLLKSRVRLFLLGGLSLLPRFFERAQLLVVTVLQVLFIVFEIFVLVKAVLVMLVLRLVLGVVVHFYCVVEG